MKKFLAILASLIIIIVIGFVAFIKFYVTPERVKGFVVPMAEESLNRKVDIGEISINIFKGIGLKDFSIKESDGKTDFVKCKEFVLKFKLLPLLSKQVIIDELKIVSPQIRIHRNKEGIFNFEDIGKKQPSEVELTKAGEESPVAEAEGLPISLLVSKIIIDNAGFSFTDLTDELPDIKSSVNIDLGIESIDGSDLSTQGSIEINLDEIVLKGPSKKRINNITAALKYALEFNLETYDIKINTAELKIQEIPVSLKGSIKNLKTSPDLDISLSLPDVNTAEVIKLAASFVDIKDLKLSGALTADLKVTGRPDNLDTIKTDVSLKLSNIVFAYDKINSTIDGSMKFKTSSDNINIEKADLKVQGIPVSIKGSIKKLTTSPDLDIALSLPKVNTADALKMAAPFADLKGLKISGVLAADLKVKGKPDNLDTIKTAVSLKLNNIAFAYDKINSTVDGSLKFKTNSDNINIEKVDLKVQGIPVSLKGSVKKLKTSPYLDVAISLPEVRTAELQKLAAPFVDMKGLKLSGSFSANLKLKGTPEKPDTLKTSGKILMKKIGVLYEDMNALIDGSIKFTEKLMSINIKSSINKNSATIKGTIKNYFKNQDIKLNIYSKKLFIDDLIPKGKAEAKPSSSGKGKTAPAAAPKEAEPLDLKLTAAGEVKIDSAIYKGLNMSNFLMKYSYKNNKLNISKMTATAGKGKFNLQTLVDLSKPGYTYNLSTKLDSLHADEVVNAMFPKAKDTVFGILSFNLKLKGAGTLPDSIKKNLNANGDFNIKDGKITDAPIAENLADFLNINELKTINLKKAEGKVSIRKRVARLDSVFISDDLSMDPKGNIGLDETLDLEFDLKLSPRLTKKVMMNSGIAKFIKNDEGWGVVPLKIAGTFSNPSYQVDVEKAGKRIIKKEVDKFLDQLLNKQKQPKPAQKQEPAKTVDPIKLLEEPLKELFKGLF